MEDQKATVDEKRLSKGVIRRRSATTAEQPVTDELAPAKGSVTANAAVSSSPAKSSQQTQVPLAKTAAEVKTAEANFKDKLTTATIKTPVAGEGAQPVKRELGTPVPAPVVEPKKEEPKKVLTFKDRIRGTITLKHVEERKEAAKREEAAKKLLKPAGTGDDSNLTEAEKADAAKNKATKHVKKVKDIGGDLDIEGLGKATNLQQLSRIVTVDRVFRPGSGPRKKKIISRKGLKQTPLINKKAENRVIEVDQTMSVGQLAQELGVKAGAIVKRLMDLGTMTTINEQIDLDTISLVAADYQYEVKDVSFKEGSLINTTADSEEVDPNAVHRPPIVTIMGHVDHGKTSLLDAIRSTNVTAGEAGGITQHIGAYTVTLPQGQITFLDTPGHEAFASMRARGAQVTDIVILVVAADDGVMPQTAESISHAQASGVPIIVAINKIDKEGANIERITRQLSEKGLLSEAWGGDTIFAQVSALKKTGISELLESILLQAEVLELKSNPNLRAAGAVVESKLDRFKGPVCTLLVQDGTLRVGDHVVIGTIPGKVRAMTDWKGVPIKEAGPSTAVEVLGVEGVPEAGDMFHAVESEQDAKDIVEFRLSEKRKNDTSKSPRDIAEAFLTQKTIGDMKEFNVIIKTDVQGSLEAVRDAVTKLGTEEVKTKVIHGGVGGITESDINLAAASNAMVIGFNVRPEINAIHLAKEKAIGVKLYKIIYDLVNEVKLAMQGLLDPIMKENYLGRAEIKQVFAVSKLGFIAGSMVVDGVITRNGSLRVLRENVVVFEGKITSLKRFKDDAREVKQGFECGIGIEGFKDLKAGDVIEAFEIEMIQKTL